MAYVDTVLSHFRPFWELGIEVDFINEEDSMEGYDLVCAPLAYQYREGYAQRVKKYVEEGGTYLATYFSGVADETDLCILDRHPLEEVLGIRTEEMDAVHVEALPNTISFGEKSWQVGQLREISHVVSDPENPVEVLSVYEQDYYQGFPALTRKKYGKGNALYLACEAEEGFLKALYEWLAGECRIRGEFTGRLPQGVVVSRRDGEKPVWFLQNFNREEKTVELPFACRTVEDGRTLEGSVTLKPYECVILTN